MKRVLFVILSFGCSKGSTVAPLYSNRGQVTAASASFKSGTFVYSMSSVSAGFLRNTPDPQAGCKKIAHGDCQIIECDGVVTAAPPDDGGASVPVSAGDVDITGAKQMVKLQTITSGMFIGQYATENSGMPLFAGGDRITASAPGEVAPAFSATVTAPSQPTMTAPPRATMGPLMIPRDRDFSLAWQGGGAGRFELSLTVTPPSDLGSRAPSMGLSCSFAANAGVGTVPGAALRALSAGTGTLSIIIGDRVTVESAGWTIEVAAATVPVDAMGQAWNSLFVELE